MSDSNAPEPTMEEILASIRRIISEDEPPAGTAAEPVATEEPETASSGPTLVHEEPEDVLELTEPVVDEFPSIETHGDLEIHSAEPFVAPAPAAYSAPMAAAPAAPEESLLSIDAAASASSSFSQLTQHVFMPGHGVTLEDVVRELLKPLLKSWLDTHLPGIVQAKVDEEVERIARRRVG